MNSMARWVTWTLVLGSGAGCGGHAEDSGGDDSGGGGPAPPDAGSREFRDGDISALPDARPPAPPDGGISAVPSVRRTATYPILASTHVYAEGLQHSEWGGGTTTPVELQLDLYAPEGAPPGRPALVIIHGGGFTGGSRTQAELVSFAEYFASRGWVSISIDYRLLGDRGTLPSGWAQYVRNEVPPADQAQAAALYPAARDAKAAVRWLYANAATYQIDTDYVTAMGGSAGAYLAIVVGVTDPEDFRDEVPASADPTLATTHLDQPARIRTVIDHWGGARAPSDSGSLGWSVPLRRDRSADEHRAWHG
jgi:acetyl esterase/lipase